MARRSRHNQGVPISLFSFQDVMMSIMGILVLITLMMALDLWRTASVAQAAEEIQPTTVVTGDLPQLEAAEQELRKQYEEAMAMLSGLAGLSGDQKQQIQRRLDELAKLQKLVQEIEKKIIDQSAAARAHGSGKQDKQKKLQVIVEMEQRVAQLKAESDELRRNPRITYLIQKQAGQKKAPLLIEWSGRRAGVGSPNPRESAIWIDLPDPAARVQLVMAVVGNYDREAFYVVVLLKPSGFDSYETLLPIIQKRGYDTGIEMVAEEASVLSEAQTP